MTLLPDPDAPASRRRAVPHAPGPGKRRDGGTARRTTGGGGQEPWRRTGTGTKAWHAAMGLLADPWVRLGAGAAGVLFTAHVVRADSVGSGEARLFRAVNGLPDSLYLPFWLVMQFGTLGAAPAAAGAAWLAGEQRLAGRLLADGTITWALSKLVKRNVRRPRPAMLLADARSRGRPPTGLGYLSGHAGVAAALGTATLQDLGPAATLGLISAVALSRVYVGAHLPLDIAGGAALGTAVDAAVTLIQQGCGREPMPPPSRRRRPWAERQRGGPSQRIRLRPNARRGRDAKDRP
jgi:membrane-associated phospholipid phosphatase